MNYTLRQLMAFREIDRQRNITRAAQRLGLTQSGLSALLRELEAEAGEPLFARTTRRLEPTAAGHAFRPLAERVLFEADTLASEFDDYRRGGRGRVRVGSLPSLSALVLPRLLAKFRASHPLVAVDLVEAHAGTLSDMVREGTLSVALGTAFGQGGHLRHEHLWQDEIVVLLPGEAVPADDVPMQWSDLAQRDFVAIKNSASLRTLSDAGFHVSGVRPRTMMEVGSMTTAVAFVRAGFGCTILPRSALTMLVTQGLGIRRLTGPALARDISMITPRQMTSRAAEAFRQLVLQDTADAFFGPGVVRR